MRRRVDLTAAFDCGDGQHQVVTLVTSPAEDGKPDRLLHRAKPCEQCPWRRDVPTGVFPASAFRHSAATAYDMAETMFSCHMATRAKPAVCAGFLLRGADHNYTIRIALTLKRYDPRVWKGRTDLPPLYESYREMAEANGVAPDDPALAACRGGDETGLVWGAGKETAT